jgi:hypothetical protein
MASTAPEITAAQSMLTRFDGFEQLAAGQWPSFLLGNSSLSSRSSCS